MSLVVVGSIALDTVTTPKGSGKEVLGGSASYFALAARIFSPVHIVGVVGNDFPVEHINRFKKSEINLDGLLVENGKTFRWEGIYDETFSDPKTIATELNVFANFQPTLPDHYCDLPYVFLGNIQPQLQLRVLEQIRSPHFVAADTMNYWIERERPSLIELFAKIDMLTLNEQEIRLLTGVRSLLAGAQKILSWGPKIIVIKKGEHGVMVISPHSVFVLSAYPITDITDPTGAGDSFAGAMMGYIAHKGNSDPETIRRAAAYGTIVASFCVEGFSVQRLEHLTRTQVDARMEHFRKITSF